MTTGLVAGFTDLPAILADLAGEPRHPARHVARRHVRLPQLHLARIWPACGHLAKALRLLPSMKACALATPIPYSAARRSVVTPSPSVPRCRGRASAPSSRPIFRIPGMPPNRSTSRISQVTARCGRTQVHGLTWPNPDRSPDTAPACTRTPHPMLPHRGRHGVSRSPHHPDHQRQIIPLPQPLRLQHTLGNRHRQRIAARGEFGTDP